MLYMSEKKIKKSGRNFYIPEWVSSVLDAEAERYGGPGVVVSSAIMAFSKLSNEQKAEVVKTFRNEEVERAYLDTQSIVENAARDAASIQPEHCFALYKKRRTGPPYAIIPMPQLRLLRLRKLLLKVGDLSNFTSVSATSARRPRRMFSSALISSVVILILL